MALRDFKRVRIGPPNPASIGGRGRLILFCGIGDLEGYGRPGDMVDIHSLKFRHSEFGHADYNDTHSLKWPQAGFGPAFNAIATVFVWAVFGNVTARKEHHL